MSAPYLLYDGALMGTFLRFSLGLRHWALSSPVEMEVSAVRETQAYTGGHVRSPAFPLGRVRLAVGLVVLGAKQ